MVHERLLTGKCFMRMFDVAGLTLFGTDRQGQHGPFGERPGDRRSGLMAAEQNGAALLCSVFPTAVWAIEPDAMSSLPSREVYLFIAFRAPNIVEFSETGFTCR